MYNLDLENFFTWYILDFYQIKTDKLEKNKTDCCCSIYDIYIKHFSVVSAFACLILNKLYCNARCYF